MPHTPLKKILYVEDDEALARLLQKRMERKGLTVDLVFNAEEAMQQLRTEEYDLLLVDYNLPGMSGLEMMDLLAAEKQAPPVIILTAGGDEKIALAALEKGAADYAIKDTGQTYLDLLPAIMQAAYTKERLLRENERQRRELKAEKEKAEAASQAKSNFLATMSHEIRTPMNVVTGLARILAQTPLNNEQRKMVETLRTNADLLLKLINDLLDISRIEAGQMELETRPFAFSSVLNDINTMFTSQATDKGITLRIEDRTECECFLGDPIRIQQILMNLVSNAVKFTQTGEVCVTASVTPVEANLKKITIEVHDTGIGIASEKLNSIFDKFTQADQSITRRFGGSGLGLSIARSLTLIMKGNISVSSVAGQGSAFTVTLSLPPTTISASQPCEVIMSDTIQASETKGTILIVEDYGPNIMVARMMLEDLGFDSVAAENGMKAIETVIQASQPFTAILMDVQMQDMDGLETTRRIRKLESERGFRHVIIGVTAHALAGDRERCISAGMDDYISKPIHPEILAAKLSQIQKGPKGEEAA